jgi:outer membrane protein OmpA-like peptidoglycan-associated protein
MRMRVLLATGALAAIVPALAGAQQRPATPPARPATPPAQQPRPAARPAAQPQQRPAARPAAAAAHREGSIELSIGGGVFSVDQALNGYLDRVNIADPSPSRFMFGGVGRLGYNFTKNLGLSVGSGLGMGNGATLISPFGALTYTLDLNKKMSPFITVGGGLTRFTGNSTRVTATYGGHAGVGIRSMLGENLALRLEGRMAYENYDELADPAYNGTATIGLSYFMGGGPPRDTDADGVPDKRDRCASTPRGATVDLRGCPSDTDRDGVLNGLDQCANTPANTPVDARGCTRDTDADGVADNLDRCAATPANARPVDATGCPVDTDRDTVADYLDRCANTASGVPVDANGCPRDTDNDGVTDNLDRCPNTPANARPVDATGCPVDTDRDGVADYMDTCANTAAGTQVDASGCPVARDADRDGVIDANDRCPNTPTGSRVDVNGCPLAELPAVNAALVIRNISFRAGSPALLPTSYAELDRIAAAIVATPNSRWEIGGHTDAQGVAAANMRLSQRRAQAVMTYLTSKAVPAAAMTAVGYGSTRGVAPNTTAAGRAQNRRVEIKRLS